MLTHTKIKYSYSDHSASGHSYSDDCYSYLSLKLRSLISTPTPHTQSTHTHNYHTQTCILTARLLSQPTSEPFESERHSRTPKGSRQGLLHGPLRAQIWAHSQVKRSVGASHLSALKENQAKRRRVRSIQPPEGDPPGGMARAPSRADWGSLTSKTLVRRLALASVERETGKTPAIINYRGPFYCRQSDGGRLPDTIYEEFHLG